MGLIGFWVNMGDGSDELIFSRRFKIRRGKNSELVTRISDERCFGVLCYEAGTDYSPITEIIAPVLTLEWARRAVEILEKKMPHATVAQWEELEEEMQAEGYNGVTICLFYLPESIGFEILETAGVYTTEELENAAEGDIEKFLIAGGYQWNQQRRTWQNPTGALWMVKERIWQETAAEYFTGGARRVFDRNADLLENAR